ncbi:MAG: 30S ribosomal protein S20 [Kiritimatiellaeota bacterium]|nr:30S ribosomal protein S20 [Kiritimatiellota bacterium]
MPNNKQAEKRLLTNEKQRVRNKARTTAIKTAEKKFKATIESSDEAAAKEALKNVFAKLDKGVKFGVIHKNKSSRKKSRLTALLTKKA